MNFIIQYNNTKRCNLLHTQGRFRFNGHSKGLIKSVSQIGEIQVEHALAQKMNYNCSTLFVSICASRYDRLAYFKQTADTMKTAKRIFAEFWKNRRDCKHIYNAKETFTCNDLTQMIDLIKLHMKTRNYQNFIFIAQGYGNINLKKTNQSTDYFRFTDGSKLKLDEIESQLQDIIPIKTKRQIGWELLPKGYGKKCAYQSCDKAQCITRNDNNQKEFHNGHYYCTFNKLKLCKRCKKIYYCCRNHQKKDWIRHKKKECIKQKIM